MLRDCRPNAKITMGNREGSHIVELRHGDAVVHEFYFWPTYFQEWHCDKHPGKPCQQGLTFMERKAIQEAE